MGYYRKAQPRTKMADIGHLGLQQLKARGRFATYQPIHLFFIILSFILRIATFMLLAKNKEKKKRQREK